MANFSARITVRDADSIDNESSFNVWGVFTDRATFLTALETLIEQIDDVILGEIVRVTTTEELVISGWSLKATPAAGADREIKLAATFTTTQANVKPKLNFPTFDKDTWSDASGNVPFDLNSGTPNAIDTLMVSLVDQNWTDYRWSDYNGVAGLAEAFS